MYFKFSVCARRFLLPISIVGVYDVARFAYGLAVSRLPALIPLPHKYLEGHVAAALTTCAFSFVVRTP
jgi:hypothetical protein